MQSLKRDLEPGHGMRWAIAGAIALLALQAHLAFVQNVNWDEFFYLSQVYSFRDGRLLSAFQTIHVHFLGWLTWLGTSEMDQLVAGRLFMLVAECGTLACIFAMGRTLYGARPAAFAVIVFLCSGYVLQHGASFRADPLATVTMMTSLALLLRARLSLLPYVIAGSLAALGLLMTIKCALYLPAFLGVMAFRLGEGNRERAGQMIARFALAGLCLVATYAVGWAWHSATLASPHVVGALQSSASGALRKTVLSQTLFPQWPYMLQWALMAPAAAGLLFVGIAIAVRDLFRLRTLQAAALPLLAAPLLSLVIYRNAFPYFFPFILAPAVLSVGPLMERIRTQVWRRAIIALLVIPVGMQYVQSLGHDQSTQRTIIAKVHQLFPKPVPYIDRNGMVPSFQKVGFFMSSWGLEGVLASGKPALKPVIKGSQPPLLLLNSPALAKAVEPSLPYDGSRLIPADERALRESYIPHWGPIWVAGRTLSATGNFELHIGGTYTVECTSATPILDGVPVPCGSTLRLQTGEHHLADSAGETVTLRWGDHLPRPADPPPTRPIYYGF
jgi:hypothetical protein